MNGRVVSGYLEAFNETKACLFEHQSREHFKTQNEKEMGKRIPLPQSSREIIPNGLPLMRMEKEEEEIHDSIQPIQVSLNPNFFMMANKNCHSILSKSFSMSILRNIKPPLPFIFLKVCMSSWARIELSSIFLLGTKADWRGEIILGRPIFNLLARILEMIL